MNEKLKKTGAITGLSSIAMGLIWNAYSQVRLNEIEIVKLTEKVKTQKEILLEIKTDVKDIKRLMNGNRVKH
jgi:hypothetical protein